MIPERTICELLSSILPRGRVNGCFESDAEILRLNGREHLFTMDEFSAEDSFREDDPYALGWNIAAGAISDIFAAGGMPLYYAHALTVSPTWDTQYLTRFGHGVRDVLRKTETGFLGGDCGRSELWRCTVAVIGSCLGPPVRRRGAEPGDDIYISGPVGAGNLEAALRLPAGRAGPWAGSVKIRFPVRRRESVLMTRHASACIDTSDGVWAALNTLADLNKCGFAVGDLPYVGQGLQFCQAAGVPKILLFLGECGEYELLFTVRPNQRHAFLSEAQHSGCAFHRLGEMTRTGRSVNEDGRIVNLEGLHIEARDYETPQRYLEALMCLVGESRS